VINDILSIHASVRAPAVLRLSVDCAPGFTTAWRPQHSRWDSRGLTLDFAFNLVSQSSDGACDAPKDLRQIIQAF